MVERVILKLGEPENQARPDSGSLENFPFDDDFGNLCCHKNGFTKFYVNVDFRMIISTKSNHYFLLFSI